MIVTVSILSTILVLLIIVIGFLIYGLIESNRDYYKIKDRNNEISKENDKLKEENKKINNKLIELKNQYQDLLKKYDFVIESNQELFVSYNFDDFEKMVTKLTDFQLANFNKSDMYEKFVCWDAEVSAIDENGLVELKGKDNNLSTIKFTIPKSNDELFNYKKEDIIKVIGRLNKVAIKKGSWATEPYINVVIKDAFIINNTNEETKIG